MTVDQLKELAALIATIQITREEKLGQYDVKASMMAASCFECCCQSIKTESTADFIKQLKTMIAQEKAKMDNDRAGQFNGGKATLGTCFRKLTAIIEEDVDFKIANKALKNELKSIDHDQSSTSDEHELTDDKSMPPTIWFLILFIMVLINLWLT